MGQENIFQQMNILYQCRKNNLGLWECPQFLFLIMGLIIIVSMLSIYQIGVRYVIDPEIIALIVLGITAVLLVISFIITQSFERMAEANRMKSEFIHIVSHQLRAPIINLKWTLDFLKSGKANGMKEKQYEYLEIIQENSKRIEELVNNLIMVSRLEKGISSLNKKRMDMEKLTREIILRFEPFAEASNTEIIFRAKKNLPRVFADPSQIKLVVENLLDNAIRYINPIRTNSENKKGKVEISLTTKKDKLLFEIKDNGIGMDKEEQKYIFQKFFRAKSALRYQTQGSGLGLYIVKGIIDQSGGKIWFKSKKGEGTTFWFTLPIES